MYRMGSWVVVAVLLLGGCNGGAVDDAVPEGATSSAGESGSAGRGEPEAGDTASARVPSVAPVLPPQAGGGAADTAFEGTVGIVEQPRPDAPVGTLRAVRYARHEGYDRVVFEFSGARVPGYRVEYEAEPIACGSGHAVEVAGRAWLEVRFTPARAHDEQGNSTLESRALSPRLPVLQELRLTCDFEADVTWVLGLSTRASYRTIELTGPARLVVDVRH